MKISRSVSLEQETAFTVRNGLDEKTDFWYGVIHLVRTQNFPKN